jgi:hypothetical protein
MPVIVGRTLRRVSDCYRDVPSLGALLLRLCETGNCQRHR